MTILSEFTERGYVVRRGFFEPTAMAPLIDHIRAAGPDGGHRSSLDRGALTFYSNAFLRSAALRELIAGQRVVELLAGIAGPDLWVRWDQAVNKRPGAGVFPWHQDNAYNQLKFQYYQFWIALTAADEENGRLWVDEGSHRRGLLPHEPLANHLSFSRTPAKPVPIDASPGDVIVFSSLLLHSTSPNVSARDRWAYVVEYASSRDFDPYLSPPYFVVARGGRSDPHFTRFLRGRFSASNQLRYLLPRLRRRMRGISRSAP